LKLLKQDISIKYHLIAWFSLVFLLITVVTSGIIFSGVRETLKENIISELSSSTDAIRNMVQTAGRVSVRNRLRAIAEKNVEILAGLEAEVQAGNLDRETAQLYARKILSSQTIGKTGYIYSITPQGQVTLHPSPSLMGKDISEQWLAKAQASMLSGYIEYDWANPGETIARPKALYMDYFEPWNWIVSVSSYREEFTSLIDINDFRAGFDRFGIGPSGYAFILDGRGEVIIHPWLAGNVSNGLDAQGKELFKSLLGRRDGQLQYLWKDPQHGEPRKKIMVYRYIPELDWTVASASYLDEVYAPLTKLRNVLILASIAALLLLFPIAYYLGLSFSRPISKLAANMSAAEKGDISVRADIVGVGEVAELARHFNQYMEQLDEVRRGLLSEIEERIKAEQQLKLFGMVFEHALEGISITDRHGAIIAVNPSFSTITGFEPEEVLGKNPRVLKSDRHDAGFYKDMWKVLKERGAWHGEIWNRRKNGESYPEILSISSIRDENGDVSHYVAVFHDISDMKLKDQQIEHQAYHDALTGLPNRALAQDRLGVALAHAGRDKTKVAVLYLDLDNFKNVNDSFGHAKGDVLIQEVAKQLQIHFKNADTVARLGGDEFLLIFEEVGSEHEVAEIAEKVLRAFDAPFFIYDQEVEISPSIGVTMFPDDGETPGELIKNADMAMYQSKANGKNSYFLFTKEMNARVFKRIQLESDMRQALKDQEFTVFFQPKVQLGSGAVEGVEALVRWQKPDGSLMSPADFIPLAEETGMIVPLGEFVLETSCKAMQVFDGIGCSDIRVSVNLSPIQFQQDDLVEMVVSSLERNGLSPSKLELEITESTLMTDVQSSIAKLNLLVEHGISISIDDFGTGHSSLYYLKNFPIDVLKVDRSFIRDITTDASDAQIVETIILMARNLGIGVVAEGVETKEQIEMLREFGCELIQGFYYSKPLPLEEVITYVRSIGTACMIES